MKLQVFQFSVKSNQELIALGFALLNALWLVKKTCATYSTDQMQN